jgi:hypothetical protein
MAPHHVVRAAPATHEETAEEVPVRETARGGLARSLPGHFTLPQLDPVPQGLRDDAEGFVVLYDPLVARP